MEKKEIIFAEGISFRKPHENTPDFVKGHISINVKDTIAFLQKNEKQGWVNLDLKKSKGGKLYLQLNDWQPEKKDEGLTDEDVPF